MSLEHVEPAATWRIYRHGGHTGDAWRQVGAFADEDLARFEFDLESKAMRQGGVRLFRPNGTMAGATWAPKLRTRW